MNSIRLQLAAVCVLASFPAQVVSESVGENTVKVTAAHVGQAFRIKIGTHNIGKSAAAAFEFLRKDAHPAIQKAWDNTIDYTAGIDPKNETEWQKAEERNRQRGPQLGQIFTPQVLERYKAIARTIANVDMENVQKICDFFTAMKDEQAYSFFHRIIGLCGPEQYIRKAEDKQGKSFNLPVVDSNTPLKSTTNDAVLLEVLESVVSPKIVEVLGKKPALDSIENDFDKTPDQLKNHVLQSIFQKPVSDDALNLFKTPIGQAVYYAGLNMTDYHILLNGDPAAPEKGKVTIADLNEARLQYAAMPLGNSETKAQTLATARRADKCDILFSQEAPNSFSQRLENDCLAVASQNHKDGTLVFIAHDVVKGNTYTPIKLSEELYKKCAEGNLSVNLGELEFVNEEGSQEVLKCLFVSGHPSSSRPEDALDQIKVISKIRDTYISELEQPVAVIFGMDANTTLKTIGAYEAALDECGLVNLDPSHTFTSWKQRGKTVQLKSDKKLGKIISKSLEPNEGPKDQLGLDKGLWNVFDFAIGGYAKENQPDITGAVLTEQNPSDHIPVTATIELKSRKERENTPLYKHTKELLVAKVLATKAQQAN